MSSACELNHQLEVHLQTVPVTPQTLFAACSWPCKAAYPDDLSSQVRASLTLQLHAKPLMAWSSNI